MFTSLKKEAAIEKYVADPPKTASFLPNGVWTESIATEPTTSMLISQYAKIFSDPAAQLNFCGSCREAPLRAPRSYEGLPLNYI